TAGSSPDGRTARRRGTLGACVAGAGLAAGDPAGARRGVRRALAAVRAARARAARRHRQPPVPARGRWRARGPVLNRWLSRARGHTGARGDGDRDRARAEPGREASAPLARLAVLRPARAARTTARAPVR